MKNTILLLALLAVSYTSNSQIQGNLLKVQGESILSEIPDEMNINISIMVRDSVYSVCSNEVINKYNLLVNRLIQNGIEKSIIKTDRVRIEENYDYVERKRVFNGYSGSINIIITEKYTSIKLNQIVNTLKEKDINLTFKIDFQLSNDQKNELKKKSIQNAIIDATNKAKIIAESMNLKLGEIKEINYGYISTNSDILTGNDHISFASIESNNKSADLVLNPEEINIYKNIGIIWAINK